jgi:hypothetical protein
MREGTLYHKGDMDLYSFHLASLLITGVHADLGMRTLLPANQSAPFPSNAFPLGARGRRVPRLSAPRG